MTIVPAALVSLEALPCAAVCADHRGCITAANDAFARLWTACGRDPASLLGEALSSILAEGDRPSFTLILSNYDQGRSVLHERVRVVAQASAFSLEASRLTPDDNGRAAWLVLLREEASTPKVIEGHDDGLLAASVAHDLKTPLQAVLGWVWVLKQKLVARAGIDEAVAVIERNAQLQVQIVNEMLELTRRSGADSRLEQQPVDLVQVVRNAATSLKPIAGERRITVAVTTPLESQATVWGHRTRLHRIVNNLLSNAIKFAKPGGRVECRMTTDGGWIRLEVRDDGRGIARDFMPHLFDPFRRESVRGHAALEGSGLGLAVVRHLVELHGGRVCANSDGRGQGATFVVTLPRAQPKVMCAAAHRTPASRKTDSGGVP